MPLLLPFDGVPSCDNDTMSSPVLSLSASSPCDPQSPCVQTPESLAPPDPHPHMDPDCGQSYAVDTSDEHSSDADTEPDDMINGCTDCFDCSYYSGNDPDNTCKTIDYRCVKCELDICGSCYFAGGHKRHRTKIKKVT